MHMSYDDIENLRLWLIEPLGDKEAETINKAISCSAAVALSNQNFLNDIEGQLAVRKKLCQQAVKAYGIDARAVIFILFGGTGDPYAFFKDGFASIFLKDEAALQREFCALDIVETLRSMPMNINAAVVLKNEILGLAEQLAIQEPDANPAVYRSLYAAVTELIKPADEQRAHVVWKCWGEVFLYLCVKPNFGPKLALISFLLLDLVDRSKDIWQGLNPIVRR